MVVILEGQVEQQQIDYFRLLTQDYSQVVQVVVELISFLDCS